MPGAPLSALPMRGMPKSPAISPTRRSTAGIGRQLYARVEELLCRQGCRKVFAVVTSANEPSLAFHRSIGYRDAACFRQVGFKFGRWYDVTWLEKSLCPPGKPSEFPISWKEVL